VKNFHISVLLRATGPAPTTCTLAGYGKLLSGAQLDSASALWQRGWLQLTSGDFHSQGNPAKATPVTQQQAHRVHCGLLASSAVYRDRTCSVCKSANETLMWGKYSHIDTSLPPTDCLNLFNSCLTCQQTSTHCQNDCTSTNVVQSD
jgi:hypothetical protein